MKPRKILSRLILKKLPPIRKDNKLQTKQIPLRWQGDHGGICMKVIRRSYAI